MSGGLHCGDFLIAVHTLGLADASGFVLLLCTHFQSRLSADVQQRQTRYVVFGAISVLSSSSPLSSLLHPSTSWWSKNLEVFLMNFFLVYFYENIPSQNKSVVISVILLLPLIHT